MAVERAKVLAALNLKYKGKSLSKNFKDTIAEKWAAKIESDDLIDAFIEDRDDIILEASKEADSRATNAAAKAKQEAAALLLPTEEVKKDDEIVDDPTMPEWAKEMRTLFKTVTEKVSSFEQLQSAETIAQKLAKDDRMKNVPDFVKNLVLPSLKAENYETKVTELAAAYSKYEADNKIVTLGNDKPAGGQLHVPDGKEASKEQLDAVMNIL